MDVSKLQVIIETKGVEAAQRELDKLAKQSGNAEKSVGGLASSMKALGAIASLGAMATLAKEYAQVTDSMKLLEARIKLVSNASENYASIQKNMTVIANENGVSIKEVGNLYTKLSMSLKPLGITTNSVMQVTDAFSKTLLISGASIAEASSATQQFAQAMASGRLQGDEFRSMAENSPRFMKAMTDSLGKTSAELRQMAEDGKLTSSVVGGALIDAMAKLREEARNMPMTVGKAFNELKNEATLTVEQFDKMTGTNETIAKGFQSITEKVIKLREELPKMSAEMQEWEKQNEKGLYTLKVVGGAVIDAIATGGGALYEFEKQWFKQSIEGALQTAGTIGEVTGIATDATIKAKKENDILLEGLAKTLKEIDKQAQAKKDAEKDKVAKEEFKKIVLPATEVKKQLDQALTEYASYYKAIGDEETYLQIKKYQLREKDKSLNEAQINEMINAERDKNNKTEKLAKEWQKRKIEIDTNIAIAEQDELAKPFIVLEAKYKEDLETFKSVKGAKERLTLEYNAEVERQLKDLTEKFNKEEEAKAKKSAEWQVKIFEANEKYNDEIIKMQDEMYGTDTSIDKWYDNQLEYLGKLSQEAGATAEELQTLLDKIETLKAMKLKKQTISFEVEQSFYQSFESNLADSIEGAFNGDLNFKKFFRNIGNDLLKTVSSSFAGIGTNALRGNYSSVFSALGTSIVGTTLSASDLSSIASQSGTVVDEYSGVMQTAGGTVIDATGKVTSGGSDILSLASNISSLNTAYNLISNGLSSTVMSGFSGLANLTGISGISQFGYGFTNPFASSQLAGLYGSGVPQLSGLSSIGSTAGGMALGGLGGYALGSLGDKLFGADTKAGSFGAIGGALGSLAGPIGIAIGAGLGSVIGGLFGSTKQTDAGLSFGALTGGGQGFDSIQAYADMKKKSWFSSKSWTNYTALTSSQKKQIEGIFETYDFLLVQLGETENIFLQAGKYTGETFGDELSKNFISIFTDIPRQILTDVTTTTNSFVYEWSDGFVETITTTTQQMVANARFDEIYQAWVSYAEGIDKTVMEALTASVSSFVQSKRTFELWTLGDSVEALAKKAEFANADLEMLKNSMGVTSLTVESFLTDFNNAVKANFTPETISQWESLGNALMTATDASTAYEDALKSQADAVQAQIDAQNLAVAQLLELNRQAKIAFSSSINDIVSSFTNKNNSFSDLQKSFYATTGVWVDATKEGLEKAGKLLKQLPPSESVLAMFSDLANGIEEFAQSVKDSFDKAILKGDLVTAIAELTKLDNAPIKGDGALREMRIEMEAINALSADVLKSENGFDAISTELERLDEMFKQIASVAIQIRASTFDQDYANQVKYAFGDYLVMFNTLGSGFQQLIAEGSFLPSLTSFLSSTFAGTISNMGLPRDKLVGVASVMQSEIDMNNALRSVELLKISITEMDAKVKNGVMAINDYNSVTAVLATRFEELYSATQGGVYWSNFVKHLMEATSVLASNAITYYFDDIRESVEALNKAGEEAGSSLSVASQAMNRLSNISQTFGYLADKVQPWASNDSQIKDKGIASLIAQTAEKASSLVTTEQTEAITDTLSGLVNFEGVDSDRLKQMAMLISETSAYDTGSFETAFLRLNDALIQGVVTQDEYLKLFETSTDIYRDTLSIQEEQLSVLMDIRDYQKSLLLSDASGLNTVGRYNYASIETASLAQQAKDALLGGDVNAFNSLFSEYKDISSQFLDLSKDLSANQSTYMNDFVKVYSVIDELGNMVDGSHANGLDYVPFDGYRAELHKGERVQTASEVQKDVIITELKNELRELKEIFLKNTAETTRMSKAIQRVIPDGDAISVRTAV